MYRGISFGMYFAPIFGTKELAMFIRRFVSTLRIIYISLLITLSAVAETINPDRPLKGTWEFKPIKVWEVERAEDEVFAFPFSLRVSENDHIYIFDARADINYIFDKNGRFLRSFAKSGQGPGEVIGQGHTFLVSDKVIIAGSNGIHYFTNKGEYLKSSKEAGLGLPIHAFSSEDELISAPMTGFHNSEGKGKIYYQNLKLNTDRVLAEFSAFEGGVGQSGNSVFDILVIGLSPLMTIAYHEGRVFWGMSSAYKIHVSDMEGRLINTFSIERKKTRISKKLKRDYFKRQGLPPDALSQIVSSLPNELTYFHRIEVHDGLIFVYVPELDIEAKRGKIKQIDIFSLQGKYLYKAEVKFEKGLRPLFSPLGNLAIRDGHLYAVCEKEDDSIVVAKYKISLPLD